MKRSALIRSILPAFVLGASLPLARAQSVPAASVVYHITEAASMRDALNNISNHIAVAPATRITLLANARGVFALVGGERDRQGDYAATIGQLQAKGVKFVACSTSMRKNNVAEASLLANVTTVPAGVVELTRLQVQEHYGYIKP